MPLTHVCMWSKTSWKKISVKEAASLFPDATVSSRSGLFMCELCEQYVTFTKGKIQNRHFRHSSSEKNKECQERNLGTNYSNYFHAEAHGLPIKISITSPKSFELEMGFIPVPDLVAGKKDDKKIIISPADATTQPYTYSFTRLLPYGISYLSLGNKPAREYRIVTEPPNNDLKSYWPETVEGIRKEGVLFDKSTRKKLPYDADVRVGYTYYLVIGIRLYNYYQHIQIRQICTMCVDETNWYVYEVRATAYENMAAKFFFNYHCRLTNEPVDMYPMWPVYVESPYVIYHQSKKIYMFFHGNAEPKIFPTGYITKYPNNKPVLLSIDSDERQQLLSAGRTRVLKYMYLWQKTLNFKGKLPAVEVTDFSGKTLVPGIHKQLPDRNSIIIKPIYDGSVIIMKNNEQVVKYRLNAGKEFILDDVQFEHEIIIYQGMDCVWKTIYKKQANINRHDEVKLLKKLERSGGKKIAVSHSLGGIAGILDEYPKIKKWVFENIRAGYMSEKALLLLRTYFSSER